MISEGFFKASVGVETRGQLLGTGSSLPPCGGPVSCPSDVAVLCIPRHVIWWFQLVLCLL